MGGIKINSQRGASLIEYSILVALISLVARASVVGVQTQIDEYIGQASLAMKPAGANRGGGRR